MSFCHCLITQFFLQADWGFVAKWALNTASEMKVWGQLLWAPPKAVPLSPPKAVPLSPPRCSPHDGSSAKLEAVKSPKCQTPVGMEQLELFGLCRRKADYLCWSLMGVRSLPTSKPARRFLEMRDVTNCGFPCLIRKSDLSMFTFCLAFLECYISKKVGQGVQGAVSCRAGMCWGNLQLSLARPGHLLLLSDSTVASGCACNHSFFSLPVLLEVF